MTKSTNPPPAADRPPTPPPLRIGNDERDAAVRALDAHLSAGRLDVEEYGERYARATLSRTRPELEALFVDLPQPRPVLDSSAALGPTPAGPRSRSRGRVSDGGFTDTRRPRGRRHGPALPVAALVRLVPLVAIVLLVITHSWLFLLLIPAVWTLAGRGRRCGRSGRARQRHWHDHHEPGQVQSIAS